MKKKKNVNLNLQEIKKYISTKMASISKVDMQSVCRHPKETIDALLSKIERKFTGITFFCFLLR
jgi:hypothetical protein